MYWPAIATHCSKSPSLPQSIAPSAPALYQSIKSCALPSLPSLFTQRITCAPNDFNSTGFGDVSSASFNRLSTSTFAAFASLRLAYTVGASPITCVISTLSNVCVHSWNVQESLFVFHIHTIDHERSASTKQQFTLISISNQVLGTRWCSYFHDVTVRGIGVARIYTELRGNFI